MTGRGNAGGSGADHHDLRVLLLDEGLRAGGQIWRHRSSAHAPRRARRWLERLERAGAVLVPRATVADTTRPRTLLAEIDGRAVHVEAADAIILATGARELFLPFPGWTLPGVIGAGAVHALLESGLDVRGRRVIVAGTGPLLLAVAAALAHAGARVIAVAEQAPAARVLTFGAGLWRAPGRVLDAVLYLKGIGPSRLRPGTWVAAAEGEDRVRAAVLTDGSRRWTLECDLLCVGYGLVPATELPRLLGCDADATGVHVDELQRTDVAGVYCAGEPTGIAGADAAIIAGRIAGLAAAGRTREARRWFRARDRHRSFARALAGAFALREEVRALAEPSTVVCRCEDVTLERMAGCGSMREAKLFTRAGMGPCQGRVCGVAAGVLFGWAQDRVRGPVVPVRVGSMMGREGAGEGEGGSTVEGRGRP